MFCIYCGNEICHTSQFCQYCGKSTTPSPSNILQSTHKPNITPAILALALSFLGVFLTSVLSDIGAFLSIPANVASIILCVLNIKNTQTKPISITGLCISIVGIILAFAIIMCYIA